MVGGQGAGAAGDVLARLRADVDALLGLDLDDVDGLSGPGLHRELGVLADRVRSVAARVLARVEADGRWQAGGERTFAQWAARKQGSSVSGARREAALGRALDQSLPVTAKAVADGRMSLEHAQVLAGYAESSPARQAALASDDARMNEANLVGQAARQGVDQFRRTLARLGAAVDAAAVEREHEAASAREYLTVARRRDGVAFQGFLGHEHAETVITALRAVAGVPAKDDTRTRDQRQAAALVDAARLVLDQGLAGGGQAVRPHLSVTVSWESLQRQIAAAARADRERSTGREGADDDATAWLPPGWEPGTDTPWEAHAPAEYPDHTPVPPSVLARLACDGELSRVVFGPDGAVLDVGRAQRVFTGPQRRAVIARDRHCQYPGCTAPPILCEVHHVQWWERDNGPTSVDNGILICWHHHALVHARNLTITRAAGQWRFARHDGAPLTDRPPGQDPPRSASPDRAAPTTVGRTPPPTAPPEDELAPPGSEHHQDELPLSA